MSATNDCNLQDRVRCCGRCERVFISKDPGCPRCEFGSYTALFVYSTWQRVLWRLLFQPGYRSHTANAELQESDSEYSPPTCSLPEDLRILRYHLKSAIADLDKYEGYNDSGKRYIVECVDRVISDAFKRLNHFKANATAHVRAVASNVQQIVGESE